MDHREVANRVTGSRQHPSGWRLRCASDHPNVLRFLTLLAGCDIELDALALVQGLIAVALNIREVDEHILALLTGDETVTLVGVEELHGALCHEILVSHGGRPTT